MDKRLALLLLGLLAGTAAFAQAYRWVDAEGVVHYSDRPEPGAEEIELPEANVTNVRRYDRSASNRNASGSDDDNGEFSYESLDVMSPSAEETLWNIEGVLTVSLRARPALRPGDTIRVYYDGQPRIVSSMNFEINNVWRGAHNLQAEIVDPGGKLLIRSQPIRFYVQQTSVLN